VSKHHRGKTFPTSPLLSLSLYTKPTYCVLLRLSQEQCKYPGTTISAFSKILVWGNSYPL
jgi:hypothetical protein